jgi:RNA recognition motif-containing protein
MKLFVAGLPFSYDDQALSDLFAEYGAVQSAKVINDRETGRSKGFGFVEFDDSAVAQAAIKGLDGSDVNGRKLVVKEAEDRPKGGGGGYGGGGNRGGGGYGGNRGGGGYGGGGKRY